MSLLSILMSLNSILRIFQVLMSLIEKFHWLLVKYYLAWIWHFFHNWLIKKKVFLLLEFLQKGGFYVIHTFLFRFSYRTYKCCLHGGFIDLLAISKLLLPFVLSIDLILFLWLVSNCPHWAMAMTGHRVTFNSLEEIVLDNLPARNSTVSKPYGYEKHIT